MRKAAACAWVAECTLVFAEVGIKRPIIQHAVVMIAAVTVAVRTADQSSQDLSGHNPLRQA